jgi:hypothetical protein
MIKGAAGLVPLVPSFAESSFSTVAASSGQVPILFAYRRAEHLDALPVQIVMAFGVAPFLRQLYFQSHRLVAPYLFFPRFLIAIFSLNVRFL